MSPWLEVLVAVLAALLISAGAQAGVKTAGVGHIQLPAAPAAGVSITSGAANTYTTSAVAIGTTPSAVFITGIHVEAAAAMAATYISVQLMVGASAIGQYLVPLSTGSTVALGFRPIWPPIPVATATSVTAKTADSVGSKATLVSLEIIAQSNVVDDAIPVTTVTTVTNQLTAAAIATGVWTDTTAGDFTTSASIGKSVMNGVALGTGLTVNDLTTKTGFSLAASQHVIVDSGTVTTLTNLPSIPANWLTAAGINAGALNGKGDWLLASSYTAPTNLTAAQIATGVWQDTTAGDFTTALSVGKSVMNGVSLGTGLTVASVSGAVGSVTGAVGSVTGLTASNLDTTVSSRMATYTQPTGFLAATFPSGTVANTTNITAGTITTATNLTNAPTAGDFTATMKTSLNAATPASVTGAVGSVTGNVGGNVTGSVGSVVGLTASNLDAAVSSRSTYAGTDTAGTTTLLTRLSGTRATNLDNLDAAVTSRMATFTLPANFSLFTISGAGAVTAGTVGDKAGYALTAGYDLAKTAAQAGDAMALSSTGINSIWNEPTASHVGAGSMGLAVGSAGGGSDPWSVAVPGVYAPGTAGYILGNMSLGSGAQKNPYCFRNGKWQLCP